MFRVYIRLSGSLVWAVHRLHGKADTETLRDLSVALFCLQQDPRYFKAPESRASLEEIDNADRWVGPSLFILDGWYDHRIRSHGVWPALPPHHFTGKIINITRFLLGADQKPAFDVWVQEVITRMNKVVPFPGHADVDPDPDFDDWGEISANCMGIALPPHILSRNQEPSAKAFAKQATDFITTVDWEHNMFLRSPDEMKGLGFEGVPYAAVR